jgi:hypothetical protein
VSHTLHRMGRPADLAGDWIVLAMSARGINRRGSAGRLKRFLRMSLKHGPINFGDMRTGSSFAGNHREILLKISESSLLNVVFDSEARVRGFLAELRNADLGLSVVVSGLLARGCRCVREAGLSPNTLAYSLGIWGRKEKLPESRILEITTMCGHGLVSFASARRMEEDVAAGRTTAAEASARLARACVCGAFNPVRAARLLARPRASREGGGSSRRRSIRADGVRS